MIHKWELEVSSFNILMPSETEKQSLVLTKVALNVLRTRTATLANSPLARASKKDAIGFNPAKQGLDKLCLNSMSNKLP